MMIGWVCVAVAELFHPDFYLPPALKLQGAALAVVFAGYALGWRWELAGGLLAVVGTAAFFAINTFIVGTTPELAAAWFAVPGVLYLEAWRHGRRGEAHPKA